LFPEKTAVAGFIRRHKLMEFEKSRLGASEIANALKIGRASVYRAL
jgi:predicted transcriptional regulator